MADTINRKRVTLHPLKDDGTMDLNVVTQPELDEAIDNIEQEIQDLPKGDVTEEELQTVVSTLEGVISTKATQEDINVAVADKVTEEHLQEVKTDLEDQMDTKADDLWYALDNKLLEYNLRFYWDSDKSKIILDSSVEDWMESPESFEDRLMLISVNGSIPVICKVNKHISSNLIEIYLNFEDFGTIYMYCNIKDGYWNINLDKYFSPIYDDGEFASYLEISNGEVVDDNVIKPHWITSFNDRVDVLSYAPAKAWVGIDNDWRPGTIYNKLSEDKYTIIICIQTSKGEYKLTYQYVSDPL